MIDREEIAGISWIPSDVQIEESLTKKIMNLHSLIIFFSKNIMVTWKKKEREE